MVHRYARLMGVVVLAAVVLMLTIAASQSAAWGASPAASSGTGAITGRVTGPDSSPVPDFPVYAFGTVYVPPYQTDASGVYTVAYLPPGRYQVRFGSDMGYSDFSPIYYNQKPDAATADWITVTADGAVHGIDARLDYGAQFTGRVTALRGGAPISDAVVCAYDRCRTTNSAGVYTVAGMASGAYQVEFYPPWDGDYLSQIYGFVTVTVGSVVTGVDAALAPAGHITGQVTISETGAPLTGTLVQVFPAGWIDPSANAWTDAQGIYTVTRLYPGIYRLKFWPVADPQYYTEYLSEYYHAKPDLASADLVTVTASAVVSNINAALQTGGKIIGQVTSAQDGRPLNWVLVNVFDVTGKKVRDSGTGQTGWYTVTGLTTGEYRLQFGPNDSLHVAEYYQHKPSLESADPISVTVGQVISPINAVLDDGGLIVGKVTLQDGSPLARAEVGVYDAAGNRYGDWSTSWTNSLGVYTSTGLPGGEYRVQFRAEGYATRYYGDRVTFEEADPVTVVLHSVTSGVDAVLKPLGRQVRAASSPALTNALMVSREEASPFYSLDGGRIWQPVRTTPWAAAGTSPLVAIAPRGDPAQPVRLMSLASSPNWSSPHADEIGLYRTGDWGQTWARYTFPTGFCDIPGQLFQTLVASPANPARLYVAVFCKASINWGSFTILYLFTSGDSGITWQPMCGCGPVLVPSPSVAGRVYIGTGYGQWWQSDDAGQTCRDANMSYWPPYLPVTWLALDAQDSQRLYGIQTSRYYSYTQIERFTGKRSVNGGNGWVDWAQQPCPTSFQQLMAHPTATNVLLMRCDQGLYRSRTGGDTWEKLSSESGVSLAPDYGTAGRILWVKDDDLWASTDQGTMWTQLFSWHLPYSMFLPQVTLAP